jgi:hypothetical protein
MPPVDRNILRLGVFELLWRDDVPDPVVLSEAVELARNLSTEESPKFVNGCSPASWSSSRSSPETAARPAGRRSRSPPGRCGSAVLAVCRQTSSSIARRASAPRTPHWISWSVELRR